MQRATQRDRAPRWDQRLYPGLRVEAVPAETRAALVQAAGALGVEAEYVLGMVRAFLTPSAGEPRSRERGELFLWQLEASASRLRPAAATFEVTTQSYLAALTESYPEMRGGAHLQHSDAEPWWPAAPDEIGELASLDLCLRRCGFSYRHAVAVRLTPTVEALAEQLSLLLHALDTLPPVGVLPLPVLYAGLDELASTFQGHVVPHLLADISPDKPGLLAGIRRLRELDASEDRSIEADIVWARAQLSEVSRIGEHTLAEQRPAAGASRGGLMGLFRRAAPARAPSFSSRAWVTVAEREWHETIAALESIRTQANAVKSSIAPG
jgi:hypothetical protein